MLKEIFNSQSYYWNPYAIPMFITAAFTFLEGFWVYYKGKELLSNRLYGLWLLFVTIWLFGTGMVYLSKEETIAAFWYKDFGFLGVAFISLGSYMFSLSFLFNSLSKKKRSLIFLCLIIIVFCLIETNTDLIVKDWLKFYWGLYPHYHYPGSIFFLLFWGFLYIMTVITLIKAYKNSAGIKKKQLRFILFGTILAYLGAVDFLPAFGIEIYPIGFLPVAVYFSIIAYVIIRYRAFEIDTVIHRTALWAATSLWLVLPAYILFKYARYWLESLNTIWLTISCLLIFYLFLWYYRYFQPRIDHFFRRRKYDYQAILSKIAEKTSTTINIEELAKQLLTEVCETMYLRNSSFYLLAKDEKSFYLIGRRAKILQIVTDEDRLKLPGNQKELASANPLFARFTKERETVEKEKIELDPKYESIRLSALSWLKEQDTEVVVPLVLENKVNGLLCLGKKENLQSFTIKDIQLLKKLGQEVGVTVFNALHYKDLLEKDRLEEELKLGKEIQTALLPKKLPEISGLTFSGLMLPAKEIGGDYYDFITLPKKDELGIAIGDVSGKGVGAGLIMAATKATLKGLSQQGLTPKQILSQANKILYEYTAGQKFMTLLYLTYEAKEKTLCYSSAGHERIFLYRASTDSIEAIQLGGFMLGMVPDIAESLEEKRISLNPKDKILLYTDGVTEAQGPSGERFGLERLKESFKVNSQKTPVELIQAIKTQVFEFISSQPQYDDITLVGMEAG